MNNIKVTCISENTSFSNSLLASHGQSLLLEIDNKKYLFDTTEIYEGLSYNMKQMNIQLNEIETVVLSHNHLDHSGALFKLIDNLTNQRLFLPPDMKLLDEERYNTQYRTDSKEKAVQKLLDYKHTTVVTEGLQIDKNLFTTGVLDAPDKEQSLVVNIPHKGLVLLIGCAHPTLPVIVEAAKKVTGIDTIYGIIGGLHYIFDDETQVKERVAYIKSLNVDFIVPSHCTGYKAIRAMQQELGEKVYVTVTGQFGTGSSFTILPDIAFHYR